MSDHIITLLIALVALAANLLEFLKKQYEAAHKTVAAIATSLFG